MEREFSISAADGATIVGVFHEPVKTTTCAVILVHGLTGHMNEYLHLLFARFLVKKGKAVFRFNQYDDTQGARRFHQTTIRTHVADTRSVMEHARRCGYKNLALIGHSLGAPISIAAADTETRALLLWDPTASPAERIRDWETHDSHREISFLDWRIRVLLGKDWIEDARSFPDSFEQLSNLKMPVKIIAAEHGGMLQYCDRYRAALGGRCDFSVISGAHHVFAEEGAVEMLSTESSKFLDEIFEDR